LAVLCVNDSQQVILFSDVTFRPQFDLATRQFCDRATIKAPTNQLHCTTKTKPIRSQICSQLMV